MTAIAALVAHLISTGIPPEAVARAVDLAQQHANESAEFHRNSTGIPPDTAAERRRAYDRERKRNSTGKGEIVHKDTSLLPSSESQEKKEGVVGRVGRGNRLPADWTLPMPDACFAVGLIGDRRTNEEAQKFRDYWHARAGPGGVKLDWSATWRNWIRKAAENGQRGQRFGDVSSAADDLIARAESFERENNFGAIDVEFRRVKSG